MPYRHPAIKRCLYILFICVVVVDRSFNRTLSNPKEVHNCYLIRGPTVKKTLLRSNWPQTLWHENIWNIKCFVFIGVTTILFILQLGLWQREELPLHCFSTHWALVRSLEKKKTKVLLLLHKQRWGLWVSKAGESPSTTIWLMNK